MTIVSGVRDSYRIVVRQEALDGHCSGSLSDKFASVLENIFPGYRHWSRTLVDVIDTEKKKQRLRK